MIRLTVSQIVKLHEQLIQQTGGSYGIRDMGLLESAVEAPLQSFGEHELYPSIQAKAARLGYGLIKNHAMIDGNKRIGAHAMLVMLALNGVSLQYTQKDLYTVILDVAAGQKVVVATLGTKLYDGDECFTIKKSKLRGVESNGMICAEDEIGIGTSHEGIIVLPEDVVPGTLAKDYYNIKSDYVLELLLTVRMPALTMALHAICMHG